ncbi:MAG: hypothetical protein V4549_07290, partial [Bacteroidota bacterium]
VTYAQASSKDSRSFIDEHVSKKKAPIHEELETAFESLREPLLDICGYPDPEAYITDVEMTGVTYNNKGFILSAKLSILEGEKTINLITPLIKDGNEYPGFMKVIQVLDKIYEETRSYMAGEKSFSDEQLVLKFNSANEGFDAESFKKLSKGEQREIATKVLQDQGSIVFHPETEEDVVAEAEGAKIIEAVMNVVSDEEADEMESEDDFELDAPLEEEDPFEEKIEQPVSEEKSSKKKALKIDPLKLVDGPNGSFSIVENDNKKVSTAAKKVG